MFTINVKGYRNPRDLEMVKLKLIFFKTGYARVPKIIPISGRYDDWNPKRQLFDGNTKDIYERNQLILKEKFNTGKLQRNGSRMAKTGFPRSYLIIMNKTAKNQFIILRFRICLIT